LGLQNLNFLRGIELLQQTIQVLATRDRLAYVQFYQNHWMYTTVCLTAWYLHTHRLSYSINRRNPYSVVLFDEVEKAHPDVFNVLLQVLDDGRITDGQGRTVDFRNTVLIMTSNIGSQFIIDESNPEQREAKVTEALRAHFRPEFLNRIDETVIFDRLAREELSGIVQLQLDRVRDRLAKQGLTLALSEEVIGYIGNQGYDPTYGARPLKRAIQNHLLDSLSLEILEGKFQEGDTVKAEVEDGKVVFAKGESSSE